MSLAEDQRLRGIQSSNQSSWLWAWCSSCDFVWDHLHEKSPLHQTSLASYQLQKNQSYTQSMDRGCFGFLTSSFSLPTVVHPTLSQQCSRRTFFTSNSVSLFSASSVFSPEGPFLFLASIPFWSSSSLLILTSGQSRSCSILEFLAFSCKVICLLNLRE